MSECVPACLFHPSLKSKLGQAITVLRMYHHKVGAGWHLLQHVVHSRCLAPLHPDMSVRPSLLHGRPCVLAWLHALTKVSLRWAP
jgi:hypothetical protein